MMAGHRGRVLATNYQGSGLVLVELDDPIHIGWPEGEDRYFTFYRHELQVL
jgi:hypothetical protein